MEKFKNDLDLLRDQLHIDVYQAYEVKHFPENNTSVFSTLCVRRSLRMDINSRSDDILFDHDTNFQVFNESFV